MWEIIRKLTNKSPGEEMSVQNLLSEARKYYGKNSYTDKSSMAIKWLKTGEMHSYAPNIRREINYNVGVIEGSAYRFTL